VDNIATRRSEFYDRIKKIERPAFTNSEGGGGPGLSEHFYRVPDQLITCRHNLSNIIVSPGSKSTFCASTPAICVRLKSTFFTATHR